MKRRSGDQDKNYYEAKYHKLQRWIHRIMYPVVAISFLGLGMTLVRKFGTDFYVLNWLIDNWAAVAGIASPLLYPVYTKYLNKKMENGK